MLRSISYPVIVGIRAIPLTCHGIKHWVLETLHSAPEGCMTDLCIFDIDTHFPERYKRSYIATQHQTEMAA